MCEPKEIENVEVNVRKTNVMNANKQKDQSKLYTTLGYNVSQIFLNPGHVFHFRIISRTSMRKQNKCPKFKRICETEWKYVKQMSWMQINTKINRSYT